MTAFTVLVGHEFLELVISVFLFHFSVICLALYRIHTHHIVS